MKSITCDYGDCGESVLFANDAKGWLFGVMFGGDPAVELDEMGPFDFCSSAHMEAERKDIFDPKKLKAVAQGGENG